MYILLLLVMFSCATQATTMRLGREVVIGDIYEDKLDDKSIYHNTTADLKLQFNSDWAIKTKYRHFDTYERTLADSFNSDNSELMFIGYNNKSEIGVRAFISEIGITNQEYYEKLKSQESLFLSKYKVEYPVVEELTLKNIESYHVTMQVTLNKHNVFIFDSLFFRDSINNFRVDFWMTKEVYDTKKDYIDRFYEQIDLGVSVRSSVNLTNLEPENKIEIVNESDKALTLD